MLMRHVPSLRAKHPEIRLEITISNAMANLTRREADIAVRPVREPAETLVGRRIANIAHAVYGSPDYLSRCADRSKYEWIGLDDTMATMVIGRWVRENIEDARIALRVDALPALKDAACAGIGMALLPCYLGDSEPRLRRVRPVGVAEARLTLWLLTHNDLKRTARIQAVMSYLATALGSERTFLESKGRGKLVSTQARPGH
jgi:DNA-binding transcriptional LysR family regulator